MFDKLISIRCKNFAKMANHQKSNGSAPPRLNCAEFFRNPYGLIDDENSDNIAIGKN